VSVYEPSISMLRVEINNQVVSTKKYKNNFYFKAQNQSNVKIFFEPWKIKPLIRFNHHLVDYSLVNISQYDHMLELNVNTNYLEQYFKKIVEHKKVYFLSQKMDINLVDNFIGVDVNYTDIVNDIKRKLK